MKPILNANAILRALWAAPTRAKVALTSVVGAFSARGAAGLHTKIGSSAPSGRLILSRSESTSAKTTDVRGRDLFLGSTTRFKLAGSAQAAREWLLGQSTAAKRFTSQAGARLSFRSSSTGQPLVVNVAPVWSTVPTIQFTQGTAGNVSIAGFVTDANGDPLTITKNTQALPAGVTYNQALRRFEYDGVGAVGGTDGHVLTADDGIGDIPVTTLTLNPTSTQSQAPWTFGQPFKQGDVPSGQFITSDQTEFGATVLNRWPDNSVKFAVLSGRSNVTANTPLVVSLRRSSTAPSGADIATTDLQTAMGANTAVIGFGALSASFGSADWAAPFRQITAGKQMSSWHYRKAMGADQHLVAWLEVRCYKGGAVEVLPWIENGYLNRASPGSKTGRATFTLGGSTRYDSINDPNYTTAYSVAVNSSGTITMPHHTRIALVSGGNFSHWLSSAPAITPAHNRAYWESTRVTPAYLQSAVDSSVLAGLTTHYRPMRTLAEEGMGAGGDALDIGLLPQHSVFYCVSPEARTFRHMLSHAFSLGGYSLHYRDETTNRPLLFASYPTLTINDGSGGTNPPTPSGTSAYLYALTHHPAACYVPYLATGWGYLCEQMQFQVTLHYLAQSPAGRVNANYLCSAAGVNGGPGIYSNAGLRGLGWQWRTLAMTASVTPDADALRAQFVTALGYNAQYRRNEHETGTQGRATAPNNLGLCAEPAAYNDGGFQITAPWQDDFITMSVGLSWDLQVITDTARRADLQWFRDFKYRSPVGRMGAQNDATQWNYRYLNNYQINTGPFNGESFIWYATWGAAFTSEFGFANTGLSGNDIQGGAGLPTLFNTSYVGDVYAALIYAVEHGAPGATTAHGRFTSASNYALIVSEASLDGRRAFKVRT